MFGKPGSATAETKAAIEDAARKSRVTGTASNAAKAEVEKKSRVRINGRDTTTEPPQTNPGTETATTQEPAKKSRVRFNPRSK
ncbi:MULTISPECIES: hypothetical protein [unclassified Streptomyces]|uniref:hypothetical protein n=1 Tax=unclassified Streptomyces TaxID=2593676 RepID=UPI0022551B0D|nr:MULTISPECIES: hypothetical protein [unclassified Streptomyces]MCX4863478.1 hypothetical protein [Streptomyces sp. NBC_00906]MCX4894716.1 hypothetical protein [Streptomyces sp. NBC_00892]